MKYLNLFHKESTERKLRKMEKALDGRSGDK